MDVFAELKRFIEPFDASVIEAALLGRKTTFDVDGEFFAHHHGFPRTSVAGAFDGTALLAGMQAVCFLAAYLPPSDPLRRAVPSLYTKIEQRLANPGLLLYGGHVEVELEGEPYGPPRGRADRSGKDGGAIVVANGYTYFRPAHLAAPADIAKVREASQLSYPNNVFPWSGLYHVWSVVGTSGVKALVARASTSELDELDPRRSAPKLVEDVQRARSLDADAATLYLQLLALADCGDVFVRERNGWAAGAHKKAAAKLVAAGLVHEQKQPRANRKYVLAGTWEKLFAPHPAIERWKLELYGARMEGKALAAPLGRLVPLRPIHELFEAAWQRVVGDAAPGANRPTIAVGRDWVAEIRAAPHDDALRLVYADWLTEQGDPRGELVTLQCRRVQLARADVLDERALDAVIAAEKALLDRHGDVWTERVHSYVEQCHYDRGFITGITVHAPTYAKRAGAIHDALPLLEELQLSAGAVGPIPRAHIAALADCEPFSKITRLDLTPDHYLKSTDELELLLEAPQLPRLRWLRLGFHRQGDGFGKRGAELIASSARLTELRFLEIAGQSLALHGVKVLLDAKNLAKLEMLRLPYNGLRNPDVDAIIGMLEAGALPALRVLDLSNVVETDFVTNACSFYRNRIDLARAHALTRALAKRRGSIDHYSGDTAKGATQGGFTGEALEQTGRYPFAERAKSGTSKCVGCRKKIERGAVRIGIERMLDAVGKVTSWVHPGCRDQVDELRGIADLDARLTATSPGVWPPES